MTLKAEDSQEALQKNTQVFDKMVSVKLDGDDFFKPQGATAASTEVPNGPVIRPVDPPKGTTGDYLMAAYVSTVLMIKAAQWSHARFELLSQKWKHRND
jgi:hypothetical protein